MNELKECTEKMFEDIKHIDEEGKEYWLARELQSTLGYHQWRSINDLIIRAKVACKESKYNVYDHFAVQRKMIKLAKGATRKVIDYKLSRYACYLIVMNGNPNKEVIALAQTYFAIQTRKQELSEKEYSMLTEDEKRFYQRNLTRKGNYSLNMVARNVGVRNFDKFHNAGYKGLYGGEIANDLAKRKKLRYREDILDNMNEDELVANLFRINQTKQKLLKDKVQGESNASDIHYEVGKKVRKAIKDIGGTMPEDMPTPKKSLKELEKENKKLIVSK